MCLRFVVVFLLIIIIIITIQIIKLNMNEKLTFSRENEKNKKLK